MGKGAAIFVIVLIVVGAIGGLEYYASTQLTYKVESIHIDSTALNLINKQLNMRMWINLTSPTGIPIWLNGGTYHIKIDSNDLGDGQFGEILATKEGGVTIFTLNATGISTSLLLSLTSYLLGNDIAVEITIKTITVLWVITLTLNLVKTETININH
jgi:hypothetical protein